MFDMGNFFVCRQQKYKFWIFSHHSLSFVLCIQCHHTSWRPKEVSRQNTQTYILLVFKLITHTWIKKPQNPENRSRIVSFTAKIQRHLKKLRPVTDLCLNKNWMLKALKAFLWRKSRQEFVLEAKFISSWNFLKTKCLCKVEIKKYLEFCSIPSSF